MIMVHFNSNGKRFALAELPVLGKTLPEIFSKQATIYGSTRVAMRYKADNRWQEHRWSDYFNTVQKIAAAFTKLDLKAADKVCLLSRNCPEWLFIYMAVQSLGCYVVPIYPNSTPEQVQYIVKHSEARILVVENREQLLKTDNWRNTLPDLTTTILLFGEALPDITAYSQLLILGSGTGPNYLQEQIEKLTPDSPAGIIYTSGTTGPPKGVILTQKNLIFVARSFLTRYHDIYEEETISFLPLSHIAEQLLTIVAGTVVADMISFAQSIETVRDDLLHIRPTLFLSVPRLYEKVYATILETIASASFLKRHLFNWALKVGDKVRKYRNSSQPIPDFTNNQWRLAEQLVFKKIRKKLGLERAHFLVSGAAPLSAEVSRFFGSMGMDIYEVFGLTETTGICCTTLPGKTVPGAVGPPLAECEVVIADDGEILTRGENIFSGYWKDDAASNEVMKDGWFYTGDVGYFDEDGYIHITDRKKEIIVTAGGKNIAPQNIENMLKLNQGVSQVVVIGDKRRYLTCLFTLNKESLPKLCAQLGIGILTSEEAVENKFIIDKFQEYIEKVNSVLARFETIKYFRILPNDFSVETGELTPTLKLKRRIINEKYKSIIDLMYA
jgi:long-chain acyl-CoA synthetase